MKKVSSNNKVYAIYDHIGNLKNEVMWYGEPEDFLQAAKMGYDVDKTFRTHRHVPRKRTIPKTQEAFIVVAGCLEVSIYDDNKKHISDILLYNGSICILYAGFHGARVMCNGTVFYEVKHGQFTSVKEDKEFYDTTD